MSPSDCNASGCGFGPECDGTEESCCWARAQALKKFQKSVLQKFIFEVIFDVIVSVLSVITDIIALGLYLHKGRWGLAVLTGIPVLLPTIVFTNVYLADETQGYCKLPKVKRPRRRSDDGTNSTVVDSPPTSTASTSTLTSTTITTNSGNSDFHQKVDFHCGACHMLCVSCSGCWGGLLKSICHKDPKARSHGLKMMRKSVKRLLKYLFGTFVLRYISLAWYAKALTFGIRAYREPKKYIRTPLPTSHWSYDLLVKLDFLQAALENAPQCVIQLFVLLVYPDENVLLGMLTLIFSFLDFVRVSVCIQWDVHKGPVRAPSGCYRTTAWKMMNMSSWVFLYIGRSAALALVFRTAHGWSISIPVIVFTFHICFFTKLFYKTKYGVAAQKVLVSVFISIFFLPEFDSSDIPILTQLYYAVIHIENLLFVVPWNGMNYDYCIGFNMGQFKPPLIPRNATGIDEALDNMDFSIGGLQPENCLIKPTIIVIAVPTLTMIGIIMRLASSQKMSKFKKSLPPKSEKMEMEERITEIYTKKWTKVTFNVMYQALVRMVKSEETINAEKEKRKESRLEGNPVFIILPTTNSGEPPASTTFLGRTKRSFSMDAKAGLSFRGKSINSTEKDTNENLLSVDVDLKRSKSHDDVYYEKNDPLQFFKWMENSAFDTTYI